jgi:N utilization substance protein B
LDKISKVDLVILRIAIFEILYGKHKVPEKVAIDEAVELAKEFGNETSSKFVNGVLGTVVSLKKEIIQNG